MQKVPVPLLVDDEELIPTYATTDASGADARARIHEPLVIQAGATMMIPTGIRVEIPSGYEIQVRPRSGLALKKGITVLNTPGTIDSDYRGEVGVILINLSAEIFTIEPNDRIAQLVFCPVVQVTLIETDALESSDRGTGGFGSTGKN